MMARERPCREPREDVIVNMITRLRTWCWNRFCYYREAGNVRRFRDLAPLVGDCLDRLESYYDLCNCAAPPIYRRVSQGAALLVSVQILRDHLRKLDIPVLPTTTILTARSQRYDEGWVSYLSALYMLASQGDVQNARSLELSLEGATYKQTEPFDELAQLQRTRGDDATTTEASQRGGIDLDELSEAGGPSSGGPPPPAPGIPDLERRSG